jgi:hypothetical protein
MQQNSVFSAQRRGSIVGRSFHRELVVNRSRMLMLMGAAFFGGTAAADAGPCTAQIAQVEQQIHRLQTMPAPGRSGQPSAAQSIGAQLHRQPTPQSVESAESEARIGAEAALNRARKADAAGDVGTCERALEEARAFYGLQ